jgi:hypothetical protein
MEVAERTCFSATSAADRILSVFKVVNVVTTSFPQTMCATQHSEV